MRGLARRLSQLLFRAARRDRYQPAPKRVLLASDDDELRAGLLLALEKDQHHVVELDDGLELLDYLEVSRKSREPRPTPLPPPHVIIASLGMSGMSGLALLEALHRQEDRTPFIGLAVPDDAGCFDRARSLGIAYIFETPLRLDDVRAALHSLPGGAFPEGSASHDARLAACRRGTHFMHPDSEG